MSQNNQRKIAVINDFTGFGKCSLAVSLPVISAMKIQCCPLPTSILSNHTEYESYFFDDYTEKMEEYISNWRKLNLKFEGIATGFLGSKAQIDIVGSFIKEFKNEKTAVLIDPVMGDHGQIYDTFTDDMCKKMRELIEFADIITPNLTEACILTGMEFVDDAMGNNDEVIIEMAERLSEMGPEKVVITGIIRDEFVVNYVNEKNNYGEFLKTKKLGVERSGTGDLFSSILIADAVNGLEFRESVIKASVFISECIKRTIELDIPPKDGVCFEELLYKLQ